jgi:hypothetical protein
MRRQRDPELQRRFPDSADHGLDVAGIALDLARPGRDRARLVGWKPECGDGVAHVADRDDDVTRAGGDADRVGAARC